MKLLFRREQTTGRVGRVQFRLWAKLELDEDEQAIVKRYRFDEAVLIEALQPRLLRNTALIGLGAFIVGFIVFYAFLSGSFSMVLALAAGIGAGYWYFNEKRETIFMRDLLHGRHFSCPSVIELAHKEAFLEMVTSFVRQVMESAKHWDGTETVDIPPLPKAEAKYVMLKGL